MSFKLNAITGLLDLVGVTSSTTGVFVHISGDTMTGDLIFPVTGFIMTDPNGVQWRVTIDILGSIVTTQIVVSTAFLLLETGNFILLETGDKIIEG